MMGIAKIGTVREKACILFHVYICTGRRAQSRSQWTCTFVDGAVRQKTSRNVLLRVHAHALGLSLTYTHKHIQPVPHRRTHTKTRHCQRCVVDHLYLASTYRDLGVIK